MPSRPDSACGRYDQRRIVTAWLLLAVLAAQAVAADAPAPLPPARAAAALGLDEARLEAIDGLVAPAIAAGEM